MATWKAADQDVKLFLRFDFAMMNPVSPLKWDHQGFTINKDMNVIITKRESKDGI